MAQVEKIDSNVTELRYAEEVSFKTLPGSPTWNPLEPNSYGDFGGEFTLVARNPINSSRQRQKGVITDLDATGGFNTDLTQENMQDLLQGFTFSTLEPKGEEEPTDATVQAGDDTYDLASSAGFQVDDLIFSEGFANVENNGLKNVTGIDTVGTDVSVAQTLVTETAPAGANIVIVGHEFQSGEVDIDVSGSLPRLVRASGAKDFTTFGLIPGEWVFVGGDGAGEEFVNAENNGYKRVRQVGTTFIEFDKSESNMVAETGTGLTIQVFFGSRILRNRNSQTDIIKRTYQLERTLGAPDDALPSEIQAEYLVGATPSEFTLNVTSADKVTADLTFLAGDNEQIDGPTALKTGSRPAIQAAGAFNASSDVPRIRMALFSDTDEAPQEIWAFTQELTITINNNLQANKAVSVLGSCNISAGTFQVGGSLTAYFNNVSAITAIRNNSDITLDIALYKDNAGQVWDIPLIALGDGRLNVEQDQPITLPLSMDAATAASVNSTLDHTLLITYFDYLPNAAA